MFEIVRRFKGNPRYIPNAYTIRNPQTKTCLHSDGSIYDGHCAEWWPTREQAQAVLDKYQPVHVWEHGDVFDVGGCKMMYLRWYDHRSGVMHLDTFNTGVHNRVDDYLCGATFLFNIKDKLPC